MEEIGHQTDTKENYYQHMLPRNIFQKRLSVQVAINSLIIHAFLFPLSSQYIKGVRAENYAESNYLTGDHVVESTKMKSREKRARK